VSDSAKWKPIWEERFGRHVSDHQVDRGTGQRNQETESLSNEELIGFIDPTPGDVVFDAGCGTGANILLLQSKVKRMIEMDYSIGAVIRCRNRVLPLEASNVDLLQGDVTQLPVPRESVDKILCMSVLHYLDDEEVRRSFSEFSRILSKDGSVILHVKNFTSLYVSTLWLAKQLKVLLRRSGRVNEHYRSFGWYVRELELCGFRVVSYNSFNLFMIEFMPRAVLEFLQGWELRHRSQFPLRTAFLRRRGADLKIKAQRVV